MMAEIERAYELADRYADLTDGYVGVRICRYRFPFTNQVDIDYVLTAQSLVNSISFTSLSALIKRLEELLK
jgi:hypothetical protein